MGVAIITGSGGLIGSEAVRHFANRGMEVIGIDNDQRAVFFGAEASTAATSTSLSQTVPGFTHLTFDIRDNDAVDLLFRKYGKDIQLVVHTAAQPSHDWAARDPQMDFHVNAVGTLNLLEAVRRHAPAAVFIFTSTNKVYGDTPNRLPLLELATRWEIDPMHAFTQGIDESMSIDHSTHSVFGASKVAADVLVQEFGRYFGIRTGCFRGGCLTGPQHSGTKLHGFLAYLMKCCVLEIPYEVFGYEGKQVRDNIHSYDLIQAFDHFFGSPRAGEVYNIGGSRFSNCSMREAITLCEGITGKAMQWAYKAGNRTGDHIWWISDVSRFRHHYPNWRLTYDVPAILRESYERNVERWLASEATVAA